MKKITPIQVGTSQYDGVAMVELHVNLQLRTAQARISFGREEANYVHIGTEEKAPTGERKIFPSPSFCTLDLSDGYDRDPAVANLWDMLEQSFLTIEAGLLENADLENKPFTNGEDEVFVRYRSNTGPPLPSRTTKRERQS